MAPRTANPLEGVFEIGQGLTLVDIWSGLHSDAAQWRRAALAADAGNQRLMIRDSSKSMLRELENCPAERWQTLCQSTGPTQMGAIGLSWCRDADLAAVSALMFAAVPDPMRLDQDALSLLAPGHGAAERTFSKLLDLAGNQLDQLILLVLADPRPIELDVGIAWLSEVPDVLGKVILQRQGDDAGANPIPLDLAQSWLAA